MLIERGDPIDTQSSHGCCIFLGNSLISLEKKNIGFHYTFPAHTRLYYNNSSIWIAENLVFHHKDSCYLVLPVSLRDSFTVSLRGSKIYSVYALIYGHVYGTQIRQHSTKIRQQTPKVVALYIGQLHPQMDCCTIVLQAIQLCSSSFNIKSSKMKWKNRDWVEAPRWITKVQLKTIKENQSVEISQWLP